jgi:hypothetical protein
MPFSKVVPYPILDSLNIPHQIAYDIINSGVEAQQLKYQYFEEIGDKEKSDDALIRFLAGEKLLSFMRLNALASEKSNHIP